MDVILHYADEFILDHVWAKLVPLPSVVGLSTLLEERVANATEALNASPSWLATLAGSLPKSLQPPTPSTLLLSSSPSSALATLSAWPRSYFLRQIVSVFGLTMLGIIVLYFLFAGLAYYFIFDHRMMEHPRYLKNQIKLEIQCSLWAFPGMTLLTLPWFMGEVRGYSSLYNDPSKYGWTYLVLSVPLFLVFTDYCIYWIHRWLHLPIVYKHIHKPHHKWIIPTPFASHAFHAVDGYAQSLPYHIFAFVFPMQQHLYLFMFVAVNFWSIFIHDSDMFISPNSSVEKFINTPAHHTLHHIYFTCNYGQYFTWADRTGGSYRAPEHHLDPLLEILAAQKAKEALKAKNE